MAQTRWLNQQSVGLALQQHIQPNLHRQTVNAAQAAAGNLLQRGTAIGQQGTVDPNLAKFIDQHRPLFSCGPRCEQMAEQRGFAAAQKTGNQINACHGTPPPENNAIV